jgi:dinuclear metal center YbgI/SA1388 family protein
MATTKIKEVAEFLETLAPRSLQESYDNSGLLTGNPEWEVSGVLVTLDCVENVVEEAIHLKCNLIVAHHPIIFRGQKKLTGETYVERTVIKAIKHDVAIYAVHTNLDNVLEGVNKKIAERIGLVNLRILDPRKDTLMKLVTFIPTLHAEAVIQALNEAGAGNIGHYKNCSFRITGTGTFQPTDQAHPHIGTKGQLETVEEVRAELIFPHHLERRIIRALKLSHPYEEVAYFLNRLENENQEAGAGVIGELSAPEEPMEFLKRLKVSMNTSCIRHSALLGSPIKKVAVCGGSGSFLLSKAIAGGADVFVSSDFKYHEFFDAEGKIMIADIGHFESEQFTKELLQEVLKEKFSNFAINFSGTVTNPISYL